MHGLFATAADFLMTGANTSLRKIISHLGFTVSNLIGIYFQHFISQTTATTVGWEILGEMIIVWSTSGWVRRAKLIGIFHFMKLATTTSQQCLTLCWKWQTLLKDFTSHTRKAQLPLWFYYPRVHPTTIKLSKLICWHQLCSWTICQIFSSDSFRASLTLLLRNIKHTISYQVLK